MKQQTAGDHNLPEGGAEGKPAGHEIDLAFVAEYFARAISFFMTASRFNAFYDMTVRASMIGSLLNLPPVHESVRLGFRSRSIGRLADPSETCVTECKET